MATVTAQALHNTRSSFRIQKKKGKTLSERTLKTSNSSYRAATEVAGSTPQRCLEVARDLQKHARVLGVPDERYRPGTAPTSKTCSMLANSCRLQFRILYCCSEQNRQSLHAGCGSAPRP
jgi:hypothetical protein